MATTGTGTVVTADGSTISGSTYGLDLTDNELQQLRNAYNAAIAQGQTSSQAFQTASSQVYTSTGDPLSTAIQLFQTAINLHGGPANANLTTSSIIDGYAQSIINQAQANLNNILNPTVSGSASSTYSSAGSTTSSTSSGISSTTMLFIVGGILIAGSALLLLFGSSNKESKQHKLNM